MIRRPTFARRLLAITLASFAFSAYPPAHAQDAAGSGDPYEEATRLDEQVDRLMKAGKFAAAEPLAIKALATHEDVDIVHWITITLALNNLAMIYEAQGKFAAAEPLYKRTLSIFEDVLGPDHQLVGAALNNLGSMYNRADRFPEARRALERALAIWEKALGPDDLKTAAAALNLGMVFQEQEDFARATPLLERALRIREAKLAPDDPLIAGVLSNLGAIYQGAGDYPRAESFHTRAIAICEKSLGPTHPQLAQAIHNLATLYSDEGDYAKAEPLLLRAVLIDRAAYGPASPYVAKAEANLGVVYRDKGDLNAAEKRLMIALEIFEKALGPGHRDVASVLANLGLVYQRRQQYDRALKVYGRALAIDEKTLGRQSGAASDVLHSLGRLYHDTGDLPKARVTLERAAADCAKVFGPENPRYAIVLNSLAAVCADQRDFETARTLYERALAINERVFGPNHISVAAIVGNLAVLELRTGDLKRAVALQERAEAIGERGLSANLTAGSQRQRLLYVESFSSAMYRTVSLNTLAAPADPAVCRLAATAVLRAKGRALDASANIVGSLRRRAAPADRDLLDRLAVLRTRLSTLELRGPGSQDRFEFRTNVSGLESQADSLEADLASRSAEFQTLATPVTLESVQNAIPAGAALVEFVAYHPLNPKSTNPRSLYDETHYVAYVIPSRGDPHPVELGATGPIDEAVGRFRSALRDPNRSDVRTLARALDERLMRPVRDVLGTTTHLVISPDGLLNLIPFAALVDEHDKYLVERYSISYVTSGRDLVRHGRRDVAQQPPLLLAAPDYGSVAVAGVGRREILVKSPSAGSESVDFADVAFMPLGNTEQEVDAIAKMLPGAAVLTGALATETAVKQARAPKIMHLATHGYFLPSVTVGASDEAAPGLFIANPLLRSGLALAGANRRQSGDEDGVLTALEVAGLDLWGTKLVVLSACDTGVGDVRVGDGVYGLRRALVLAGSESQVMSLWPVSDVETRRLMVAYYRGLLAGEGRADALTRVEREMLADPTTRHPFYWASFIESGAESPLDGPAIP